MLSLRIHNCIATLTLQNVIVLILWMQYVTNLLPRITAYLHFNRSQRCFDLLLRNLSSLIRKEGDLNSKGTSHTASFPLLSQTTPKLVTLQRSHCQVFLFAQLILVCCAICGYSWVGMLVTYQHSGTGLFGIIFFFLSDQHKQQLDHFRTSGSLKHMQCPRRSI